MGLYGRTNNPGGEVEQVRKKSVRVLGGDAVSLKSLVGKILEVVSDTDIGSATYRGSKNVIVFGVRQFERGDKVFKVFNETITDMDIHEVAGTFQFFGSKIGTVFEDGADPLIMDHMRPFRTEQIGECEFHEEIAQRGGIKDAGIV